MASKSTPQQLIRLVRAKKRLQEQNSRRPAHLRQTEDQIDRFTRKALRENRINDYGVILKKEP
jgi:hypothetical protein